MVKNKIQFELSHTGLKVNKKQVDVNKIKQKELYYACLYPVEKPTCLGTWNDVFENVSVCDLYLPYNIIYDTKSFLSFLEMYS